MSVLSVKGHLILAGSSQQNSLVYRSIMEILARFGYASSREVMYDQMLSRKAANNRLFYLENAGLIRKFASRTIPSEFYCLTSCGRQAVRDFRISDEISGFTPRQYNLLYEQHDRLLIRSFSAIRRILGPSFSGWVSERHLKREAGGKQLRNAGKRVLDGEFFLKVKKVSVQNSSGELQSSVETLEQWRAGVELELSLKTPKRYRRQFEDLSTHIFESGSKKASIPLFLYLYSNEAIFNRLSKHLVDLKSLFPGVVFYFGQIDAVLNQLSAAPLEKYISGQHRTVTALDICQVRMQLRSMAES